MPRKPRKDTEKPEPNTSVVTLRLHNDLVSQLDQRAKDDDRTRNRTAARLLAFALKHAPKAGDTQAVAS